MVSLWFETALLDSGWADHVRVEIAGGCISSVTAGIEAGQEDERHSIAISGLCNVHSHAFQRGMAGLSEHRGAPGTEGGDDNFWSWREVMYRFLDRIDPDDVEAIAAQAYMEMLQTGYTRVGEFHYLHNDPAGAQFSDPAEMAGRIMAAAQASGIGVTLLPVFYAHSDFGGQPPKSGQRRFLNDLDSFAKLFSTSKSMLSGDSNIGVAPHSLRAVTAEELDAVIALCPEGPIHIHAAEQVKEVEASIAYLGARPVEWLIANADVDARWCLIHATHLSESEIGDLAKSKAVAGLCPMTEANLGDGIFPAQQFLKAGGAIATGTDSNILIDAAAELRMIEYSQRLQHRARNVLADDGVSTGARLYGDALRGGAQALGVKAGISVGALADIVTLDANHCALIDRRADLILDSWIFAGNSSAIDCVWRGGEKVVSAGCHHASEAITANYRKTVRRLIAA